MSERVLITGGLGFIGLHLARHLADHGARVTILDNQARGVLDDAAAQLLQTGKVNLIECDLGETSSVRLGVDYELVFHLAALVGVDNVAHDPYRTLDLNVRLSTAAIALAKAQRSLKRFVFASTSEVYAGSLLAYGIPFPTPESVPLTISPLDQPRTSYMLSKIYGEALCLHSGLPFTIVRPHNIYGPRMGLSHVVPQLMEKAHCLPNGGILEVRSTKHRRTFCYIGDAVRALGALARNPACANQTLNLGNQSPEISMHEVARVVARCIGKDLQIRPLSPTPGSPERRAPNIALLAELTGYTPDVPFEQGVRATYDWYLKHVFGRRRQCAV